MSQQPLVGGSSRLRLSFAGRQFLEIPVVGDIPLVNRGPGRLVVINPEIELGITAVLGAGSGNSFGGTGGRRKNNGQYQNEESQ